MMYLAIALIAIFVLDALRMRGRLAKLKVVPPDEGGDPKGTSLLAAIGSDVDDSVHRRAAAFARAEQLDVVDLVPRDLPTSRVLALAQVVDVPNYRKNRLATGRTAGEAILMSDDVRERAGIVPVSAAGPVEMVDAVEKLKRYASATTDLAVVPGMRAAYEDPKKRMGVMVHVIGGAAGIVTVVQLVVFAAIAAVVVFPQARLWGLGALAAFHLQPLIVCLGTPVRPRDLILQTLLRWPMEVGTWLLTVTGRWRPDEGPDPIEQARPVYDELLAEGDSKFFEPRREDCPVCGSTDLSVKLRTRDLLQQKPGTFILEQCDDCAHIFQNPRLSIEGLNFYYKDFYDGLGEKGMEFIFGYGDAGYRGRANMVREQAEPPRKWLDVGGGHGHFCNVARDVFPETQFDGLDLSESIDEAARRKWIDQGFRGLFPELAPDLSGHYDVVSMGHYLEHTRDPIAEIEAARTALAPGGHLLIEVPDPQCSFGSLLGRYWLPWFQPQHQHLLSRGNLGKILEDKGFTPVEWHRGKAHQRVDFMFAVVLLLDRIAPPVERPWKQRGSMIRKAWRTLVWTVGTPFILLGHLFDGIIGPVVRRLGLSNTYRVLARRNT